MPRSRGSCGLRALTVQPEPTTVEFGGEQFRTADRIGLMPLMRFAKIAKAGVDADDLEGLTSLYDLLEQCIHVDEWARFEKVADDTRAQGDELMKVVGDVFAALSARPTSLPSDSSAGQTSTPPKSVVDSSSQVVVQRLEDQGRPDLANIVLMAQKAPSLASAS